MTPSRRRPPVTIPPTPEGARRTYATSASATTGQCPLNHEQLAFISLMQLLKTSLNSLGGPLDLTAKLAAMGPALEASKQIDTVKLELEEHRNRQNDRLKEIRAKLRSVDLEKTCRSLAEKVRTIVRERVLKEVPRRVEEQLKAQIPMTVRVQARAHQRQLLEIQTNLDNSEARWRNSTLFRDGDILSPIVRPLPLPAHPTSANVGDNSALAPSPSPRFPKTLGDLQRLGLLQARALEKEYGISPPPAVPPKTAPANPKGANGNANPQPKVPPPSPVKTEGEHLAASRNRLMTHFGVNINSLWSFRAA